MTSEWPFPPGFSIPAADADRLMIADILEGTDPAWAEFIRLQIEIANTPRRFLAKAQLKQESDLVHSHGPRWAGPLANQVVDYHFSRGFLNRVICRPESLMAHGESWLDRHPIRDLTLVPDLVKQQTSSVHVLSVNDSGPQLPQDFFDHPIFRSLEGLDLSDIPMGNPQWTLFVRSEYPNLKRLVVTEIPPPLAEALVSPATWEKLTHLQATRQTDPKGIQIICRAVAARPDKGPRISLSMVGLGKAQEMILASPWAKRFTFREG